MQANLLLQVFEIKKGLNVLGPKKAHLCCQASLSVRFTFPEGRIGNVAESGLYFYGDTNNLGFLEVKNRNRNCKLKECLKKYLNRIGKSAQLQTSLEFMKCDSLSRARQTKDTCVQCQMFQMQEQGIGEYKWNKVTKEFKKCLGSKQCETWPLSTSLNSGTDSKWRTLFQIKRYTHVSYLFIE